MNKSKKNIVFLFIIMGMMVILLTACSTNNNNNNNQNSVQTKLEEIKSADNLTNIITKVYSNIDENQVIGLTTDVIDISDADSVKMYTGLDNGNDLEYAVVSQPLMSSKAYSFVLAKVKSGVNANDIAKKMSEQVDTRRWICVEAEKLYATNSGDVVCLVMADSEKAKAVYDSFQKEAGSVGQLYEKTAEEDELPPEMF